MSNHLDSKSLEYFFKSFEYQSKYLERFCSNFEDIFSARKRSLITFDDRINPLSKCFGFADYLEFQHASRRLNDLSDACEHFNDIYNNMRHAEKTIEGWRIHTRSDKFWKVEAQHEESLEYYLKNDELEKAPLFSLINLHNQIILQNDNIEYLVGSSEFNLWSAIYLLDQAEYRQSQRLELWPLALSCSVKVSETRNLLEAHIEDIQILRNFPLCFNEKGIQRQSLFHTEITQRPAPEAQFKYIESVKKKWLNIDLPEAEIIRLFVEEAPHPANDWDIYLDRNVK
ncbi:hypothetical protein [Alteromonas sp. RKMC-009]|uniref:hypothetical protein n=1 Tax=Alteromonas sp. RKMC-009 TaxID=2267264 RepID=UPI000F0C15A9|nr:hypothetical protein [Alteromonas sp. RKMC-009]AYN07664.1 hypothetical protein DS731_21970 [Alteromonas sp. RKMC-009]